MQLLPLHLSDTVLGGNGAACLSHQIVDEPLDLVTFAIVLARDGAASGAHVKMEISIAEMPEGARNRAGKGFFDRCCGLQQEFWHVRDGDRYVVRGGRTFGALGFRNGIADLPQRFGLSL